VLHDGIRKPDGSDRKQFAIADGVSYHRRHGGVPLLRKTITVSPFALFPFALRKRRMLPKD
jgi:hypothetical protein